MSEIKPISEIIEGLKQAGKTWSTMKTKDVIRMLESIEAYHRQQLEEVMETFPDLHDGRMSETELLESARAWYENARIKTTRR